MGRQVDRIGMTDTQTKEFPQFFYPGAHGIFEEILPDLNPRRILQLGVFTGDATLWLLEHVNPDLLVDVDCWIGSSDEKWTNQFQWDDLEAYYDERTKPYRESGQLIKRRSTTRRFLGTWLDEGFDFIYIDADHTTSATLENAVMSYPLLKVGGIMAFDDYTWMADTRNLLDSPAPAIDAFKYLYADRMVFVCTGLQVWLRKVR